MKTITPDLLSELTIVALERTAMMLAEPAAEDAQGPAPDHFARIRYRGPSQGTLVLSATEGFLKEMAAGLLGVEPESVEPGSTTQDALKELANIVGGSVILALSGQQCEYSLGLPELVSSGDVPADAGVSCRIAADGGPLYVAWRDEGSAAAA